MESTSKQVASAMSTKYSTSPSERTETQETDLLDEAVEIQYDELFVRWSNKCERIIRIAILTFIVLLLLAQALLQWSLFRRTAVKVERLEGIPYKQVVDSQKSK